MKKQDLSGDLQAIPFAEIAGELYREKRSGSLTVSSGERARTVVFHKGSPVAVISADPRDHVARILAAKEKISQEDAGKLQGHPMTKSALQSADFIDGEILTWGLKFRFVNLCYDMFRWTEGAWSFEEGPPPRDTFLMKVPTPGLIARGVRYMSPSSLLEKIPGEMKVHRIEGGSGALSSLGDEEQALAARVSEGMSVSEVLDAGEGDPPRARQILYVLRTLGELALRPAAPAAPPAPGEIEEDGENGGSENALTATEEEAPAPAFEIEHHSYGSDTPRGGDLSDDGAEPLDLEQGYHKAPAPAGAEGGEGTDTLPLEGLAPLDPDGEKSGGDDTSLPELKPIGIDESLPGPPPETEPAEEEKPSPSPELPPPPWQGGEPDDGPAGGAPEGDRDDFSPFTVPEAVETPRGSRSARKDPALKKPPGSGRRLSSPLTFVLLAVLLGAAIVVGVGLWMGSSSMRSPSSPLPPIPPAEGPEKVEMAEGLPVPALPAPAVPPAEEKPAAPPAEVKPEPAPPEEEPPEVKIPGRGYSAGLKAYEGGDLSGAALLWKSMLGEEAAAYTIQVEVACQPETVKSDFLRFGPGSGLFVVPLQLKGRSCFRVLLGTFPSKDRAREALDGLPVTLRSGLVVRAAKDLL